MSDLRLAVRQLLKNPGFTAVVVLTLAVGIGANTVVFSWIRTVLIETIPGARDTGRLVVLSTRFEDGRIGETTSFPDNEDLASETNVFAGILGSCYDVLSLRIGDETKWVWAECTTANFFDVLGVRPSLGRFFRPDEGALPRGEDVAVFSHRFWQERFGADPQIIGRVVELGERSFTVVGIAAPEFNGGTSGLRFDVWIPVTTTPKWAFPDRALRKRNARILHTYARLRPGINIAQAQSAASRVMKRLEFDQAETNRGIDMAVLPLWKSPWGGQSIFLPVLRSLGAVTLLLLLLVGSNVANLLLARATARQQEIVVRLALGAKRLRLVRQFLTESVLLAGIGAALGCLFAVWGVHAIVAFFPSTPLPVGYGFGLDGTVLLATALLALVTGILFGLAPALHAARTNFNAALQQGARNITGGLANSWLRQTLVVVEVALALVLLAGMALCGRSLHNARQINLGFNPNQVWVAGFRLPAARYNNGRDLEVYRRLREKLASLPGVESVAAANWLPLGIDPGSTADFSVNGYQTAPGESLAAGVSVVTPDYFRTMAVRVMSGRDFVEEDRDPNERVVVINQFLADRYFVGRDPIGLKIHFWNQDFKIVGVAQNSKYWSLNEPPQPFLYVSQAQFGYYSQMMIVRAKGDLRAIGRAVETAAIGIDPFLRPIAGFTMQNHIAAAFTIPRIAATFLSAMGVLSLLLAGLGIYGVMACSVSQRTREIGVRMALGAPPASVLRLFLRQGMALASFGVLLGLAGTFAGARLLASFLIGITPSDALSYAAVTFLLLVAALIACWLPARTAARLDPMEALRRD